MKKVGIALLALIGFVALYAVGVYLGDLVGIGGFDGWAPEELYWHYQYGDIAPWLYRVTEWGAFACLGLGVVGAALSLIAAFVFVAASLLKTGRRAL